MRDAARKGLNKINDLDILARETLTGVWNYIDTLSPIRFCSAFTNSGIAHGWAGFLYVTLTWCEVSGDPLPDSLLTRLNELADLAEPSGRGLRWKWESGGQNYMPGWCNGSAGYVHLWTAACRRFPDDRFLQMAEEAA